MTFEFQINSNKVKNVNAQRISVFGLIFFISQPQVTVKQQMENCLGSRFFLNFWR